MFYIHILHLIHYFNNLSKAKLHSVDGNLKPIISKIIISQWMSLSTVVIQICYDYIVIQLCFFGKFKHATKAFVWFGVTWSILQKLLIDNK